jgi:hypothetical protein
LIAAGQGVSRFFLRAPVQARMMHVESDEGDDR